MAIEKRLNTRILLRYDEYTNWYNNNPKLLKGEVAIATIPENHTNPSTGEVTQIPAVVIKVGTGAETGSNYNDLPFVSAKAADVLAACKSETSLTAYINNVITNAKLASAETLNALGERVSTVEGEIATLKGDENTAGSVAKAIKDAIDALDLSDTYVTIEEGKSLVDDDEIAKLEGVSEGANKVEVSTNGNIKIDGVDTVVYSHPEHTIEDITGLKDALDGKQAAGDYAAAVHTHSKDDIEDFAHTHNASEITDFSTEVAKVKVDNAAKADEATKAIQDGNGDVIADTYAKKSTTYTKDEVDGEIEEAINTFVNAYITSDGEAIDKLQEIANWIDSDKDGAADIIVDIEANAEDIKNLGERADAIEEELEGHGDIVTHNISEFYTKEQADAVFTDSTEVDGQIDAKITALDLGTMSKETATDYVKKSEATGYYDILTKSEAQNAYQAKGDYYTKEEADDTFTDSTEVDGQIDAKITSLDLANTYQAKGDYATADQGAKADTALQEITTTENGGLKVTNKNQIDIDDNVVFIFDCGDSNVTE